MIKRIQELKARRGFTIVELVVVIAIIGVLAAILVPMISNTVATARITSANSNATNITKVIDAFMAGNQIAQSSEAVFKITVSGNTWSCTALPELSGGGFSWGSAATYSGTPNSSSGEGMLLAALADDLTGIGDSAIYVVFKDGFARFAAYATGTSALDGELPPINNGQPDFSGGWSNQSPSGRIIGTYPQRS
ncbi:MAG: prepilin-type N-terminal cleavage/methylation domain-containing protein [Oscillospiraceae bacterium]|nr:prepilin-type N-terminal cleavage/methylation domain-containing protein [Oscillospiraceae bacterium]